MSVKVRFAPSPTGSVHIGNIRVAIYNWLFARNKGGRFLLRVEDTDRLRCTPEAKDNLFRALEWLALDYDGEPVFQRERVDSHLAAAERLLDTGKAYRARKGGEGQGECIVFRMPRQGELAFDDLIKGRLRKQAEDTADFVIVRSDGSPVFHLANVVDDIAMGITHVIRGDDHVENTFRHRELFRALDAEPPLFASLPMIVNPQGKPYSKRDGAAFVGEFRELGYLPGALFNFLALLGWSPGDDREIMTRDEMVDLFSLDRVKSAPARFDLKKLLWMNGAYLRAMPEEEYARHFRSRLAEAGMLRDDLSPDFLCRLIDQLRPRIKRDDEIAPSARFFLYDDYPFDAKAVSKRLRKPGVADLLLSLEKRFASLPGFAEEEIENAMREEVARRGIPFGHAVHPVRVAVSGRMEGPGLFEMLALLGQPRVLNRLRDCHRRLEENDWPTSVDVTGVRQEKGKSEDA